MARQNDSEPQSLETTVAEHGAQIKQLATHIDRVATTVERSHSELSAAIQRLGEKLSDRTRPNFGTMAAWASVVLMMVGMSAAPIAYHLNQRMDGAESRTSRAIDQLDIKLQQEFRLALNTVDRETNRLDDLSRERHQANKDEIVLLRAWLTEQTAADLAELRARRMKTQ